MNQLLVLSLSLALAGGAGPAAAQPAAAASAAQPAAAAPVPPLGYANVAAALQGLQARDGNDVIVTHSDDGWIIVSEPSAAAQWSFVPKSHAAYPAVVRRIIVRANGDVSVQTSSICEAGADACAGLLKEFEVLNERILQSARARMPRRAMPPPQ